MSKKGFLSHYCCCGSSIYKRSTIFIDNNRLCSIERFTCETANTTFYDGLLMVVSTTFQVHLDSFLAQLQEVLTQDTQLPIADAILQNSIYNKHHAMVDKECHIYALSPITWLTLRPNVIENLKIERINIR